MDKITNKVQARQARHRERERLTNWYMINMVWGVVCFVLLMFILNAYNMSVTLVHMQNFAWIMFGVSLAGAAALITLSKLKKVKNTSRFMNYGIFVTGIALAFLWMALYSNFFNFMVSINPEMSSILHSNVRIWALMIFIPVYLVGAFVYYLIKINNIKVNKG